jgi:hypothetical protein
VQGRVHLRLPLHRRKAQLRRFLLKTLHQHKLRRHCAVRQPRRPLAGLLPMTLHKQSLWRPMQLRLPK